MTRAEVAPTPSTLVTGADRPPIPPPEETPLGNGSFRRRHRKALIVLACLLAVLVSGIGVFVYLWNNTGPQQLSTATAYQRFRSSARDPSAQAGSLRPRQGVYTYSGRASEHVSLPPKSQTEGPGMPGTVTYDANGCWSWRLDLSDSHWQSSTYCPRGGDLVSTGRAGWYRWDFVVLTISDTATYSCATPEVILPEVFRQGERFAFSCTGTNNPINTGVVDMTGYNEYVGSRTFTIEGKKVETLHFREVTTFSGGQSGTNTSDMWYSTADALPIHGTWVTRVSSPTIVGTSILTAEASFTLASLTPRS